MEHVQDAHKPAPRSAAESVQHSTDSVTPAVQRVANDTGLPDNLKAGIENLSGYSMNDVKVHYNSAQPSQLQAHAYAQGTDIHVAPGQERHLPHEAWHVVQQKQGRVKPTMQLKGKVNVNDDAELEKEADLMGNKASVQGKFVNSVNAWAEPVQTKAISGVVQRAEIPITITGLTHLVRMAGNSIFRGQEVGEVTTHDTVVIDTDAKVRSRRGPNQETNRAEDLDGGHNYRWFRVISVNGRSPGEGVYIRNDAFETENPQLLGAKDAVISHDQRTREDGLPTQNIKLVGTVHNMNPVNDKSKQVEDHDMQDGNLIVEHPTPGKGQAFTKDQTVRDITQETLMNRAAGTNTRIIGGDGRKAVDDTNKIHALSIRSQDQDLDIQNPLRPQDLGQMAERYIDCALGLSRQNIHAVIQSIDGIGRYTTKGSKTPPDVKMVMMNTFQRVHTITEYFKPQVKQALKEKVLARMVADMGAVAEETSGEIEDAQNHYAGIEESEKRKLNEQEIAEKARFIADINNQMIKGMVSSFHDAISNLSLFAETLASNKSNVVVAFGGEHIKPLSGLLDDPRVQNVHKNYNKTS